MGRNIPGAGPESAVTKLAYGAIPQPTAGIGLRTTASLKALDYRTDLWSTLHAIPGAHFDLRRWPRPPSRISASYRSGSRSANVMADHSRIASDSISAE